MSRDTARASVRLFASTWLLLTGCESHEHSEPPGHAESSPSVTTTPSLWAPPAPSVADDLLASFSAMTDGIPAAVGISVSDGLHTQSFGAESSGPAWSTIKAPLAIAALQSFGDDAQASVTPAISQSDNAAAEALWSMLGGGATAANAVETVLRQGGDATTVVQSERVRLGFTPFGQTDWTTAAQARFAAHLPCVAGANPVLDLMRHLGSGQQWGLAGGGAVAAKGGWGPDSDGMYLVRQLAVIGDATGALGVALVAKPNDGTFESGVAAIGQLADWVRANDSRFPRAPC